MSIDDLVTLADILRPLRDCVAQASHLAHQPGEIQGEETAAFRAALQAKVGRIGTELQDLTEYVALRRLRAQELPPNSLDSNVPVLRVDMNGRPVDAETPKPSGRWVTEQRKGDGVRGGGKPARDVWSENLIFNHRQHAADFGDSFDFCQHVECRHARRSLREKATA